MERKNEPGFRQRSHLAFSWPTTSGGGTSLSDFLAVLRIFLIELLKCSNSGDSLDSGKSFPRMYLNISWVQKSGKWLTDQWIVCSRWPIVDKLQLQSLKVDRATGRQCEKLFQEKRMHSAEEYHCFEGPRILYASRSESPLAVCMDCGLSDDTWILKKNDFSY